MVISAAEAKSLLGQTATPAISPEEAKSLLASSVPPQLGVLQTMLQRGMVPGQGLLGGQFGGGGGLVQQIRAAQGVRPFLRKTFEPPAATAAGVIGEARRLAPTEFPAGGALPGQQAALQRQQQTLAGLRARRPEQALMGKRLADIGTFLATRRGPAGLLGQIGGKGLIPTVGRAIATGFPAGVAVSPQHRIMGGALGSLAEVAPEVIPPGLKTIPKILKGVKGFVRPNIVAKRIVEGLPKVKNAESVLNELGSGRSLNENAQNIAAKIKKVGTTRLTESGKRFEDINKRAGVNSMYPEGEPVSKNSYKALEKWKRPPMMHYTDTLKDAHEDFMDIPTFDKAHKLQSTLGSVANRTLKNPASNMQQRDVAGRFLMARDRLLNDMRSHLNKIDPSKQLSTEYTGARNLHALDAVPYRENIKIHEIVRGKVQNPRNLTTIFKNPESNTLKVVSDLGSEAKDQIIYNELRATVGKNPTAEKLIKAFSGLEKKGLKSYASPKLEQQMDNLKQTAAQEEFLKQVGTKPTAERVLKVAEDKNLLRQLNPSLQDQINALQTRATRAKWIKRGAGIAGLGLLAKEFLPSHITRELL